MESTVGSPYAEVIQRLIARREMLDMSQGELARRMSTWQSNLSGWERGKATPTWSILVQWAQALRMDVKVGMILNCAEYAEPVFLDLTPTAAETRPSSRSLRDADPLL